MNKYHAKKTVVDGITFDSKAEAKRYGELKLMQRAGQISDLKLQPEFELIPTFRKNGKTFRRTVYRADFSYFDVDKGKYMVEDVKGVKTDVYAIKRKLFEYKYPKLTLTEVRR